MPFFREWDATELEYTVNRNRTGPPHPTPSTGTTTTNDGQVVSFHADVSIPPPTPIAVFLPGPNEPIIDARGMCSPRWWRFFNQLWLRTGGINDNINGLAATLGGTTASTTRALVFTGAAPSFNWAVGVPVGSMTATGQAIEDVTVA